MQEMGFMFLSLTEERPVVRSDTSRMHASNDGVEFDHFWPNCCLRKSNTRTGSGYIALSNGGRVSDEESFLLFRRMTWDCVFLLAARCRKALDYFATSPSYRDLHPIQNIQHALFVSIVVSNHIPTFLSLCL